MTDPVQSLIAIITPVYVSPEFPSRLELFDKTVASVHRLDSNGAAHLHIVVDDGSTDPSCLKRVLEKYADSRIRYLRRERKETDLKTASNALNLGIAAVLDGHEKIPEYKNIDSVTPLHSDDLMYDIASRAKSLAGADVGAALGKIVVLREGTEKIHAPDFTMSARDYVMQGIAPYPVGSIMWKRSTLAGMRKYNEERLPADQRFEGVYHPGFVNVEDVLVAKLTALYLSDADLRIAVSEQISMLYRYHIDSLSGYHQDSLRGKTEQDLWNLNVSMMAKMYYEILLWNHLHP
jgi:glycosyltransferase involved in cell wall biosynthesis